MKRHWKQGTALLLSAAMVLGSSSFTAFAEDPQTEAGQEETSLMKMMSEEALSEMTGTVNEPDTTSEGSTEEITEEETETETETETGSEEQETSEQTGDAALPEEHVPVQMMKKAAPLAADLLEEGESEEEETETETEEAKPVKIRIDSEWTRDWDVTEAWSWVYVGEEQTFTLAEEELEQFEDCEITWKWSSAFASEADPAVLISPSADGRSCTMTGVAGHVGEKVTLTAEVFVGDRQVGYAKSQEIEVREAVSGYKFPGQYFAGPSGANVYWDIRYYLENSEYPNGMYLDVDTKVINVENPDVAGWERGHLYTESSGSTVITLAYTGPDNTAGEYEIQVWVSSDVYSSVIREKHDRWHKVRPGESIDMKAVVWYQHTDSSSGSGLTPREDATDVYVEWELLEGKDIASIEVDKTNDRNLRLMVEEGTHGRKIHLEAHIMRPKESGGADEVARAGTWVTVDKNFVQRPIEPVNGLKKGEDGKFYYYVDDVIDTEYEGIVSYDGGEFYVKDGTIATDMNGLYLVNDLFQFFAQGQIQSEYKGLVQYDNEWFYLEDGFVNTSRNGIFEHDGGKFIVCSGRIAREVNGLWKNLDEDWWNQPQDGKWYFAANGQIQTQHTGVAAYDGEMFYIIKGELATNYKGTIKHNGVTYNVVNGQLYKKR